MCVCGTRILNAGQKPMTVKLNLTMMKSTTGFSPCLINEMG